MLLAMQELGCLKEITKMLAWKTRKVHISNQNMYIYWMLQAVKYTKQLYMFLLFNHN